MNKLLTIKDFEALTQVTRKTVLKWIKSGGLKGCKVGGTSWRIQERDLNKFIEGKDDRKKD
jgi:excisionase family DNA binding protein